MAINLGNIVASGDKTVGSGIASGLDAAGLIEGLIDVKKIPVTALEDTIAINTEKITAFGELRAIMESFKTSVDFLRKPPGFNSASDNIFEFRTAALLSNTSIAASNYMSVTAAAGASTGSFSVQVGNLAEAFHERSQIFTSQNTSVTEAASGATSGMFSAGTFQFTTMTHTAIGDKIAAADYSVDGVAGTTVLTAAGINNITVTNSDGDDNFIGVVSGLSATFNASSPNTVDLSVTINGSTYARTGIEANTGGGSNEIAAGAITLTDATSGNTFDIILNAGVVVANQTNADTLATNINADLATQTIYQKREIGNFDSTKTGTVLSGLERTHVQLYSSAYDTTDKTHGSFGEFSVAAVSGVAASDATISVIIDGETYQAIGLGSAANDTHTANITLSSTTTNKTLSLDISTAGVSLDFSDATNAAAIEDALDEAFGSNTVDVVINETDSLVDIAATINSKTGTSGVSANVMKINDSEYRLDLKSTSVGIANKYAIIDSSGVLSEVSFSTQQAAENSLISIDGIDVYRTTNIVSDVITGLSFNLLQETPDFGGGSPTTITTTVTNDVSTAEAGIVNFVNSYNTLRIFIEQHSRRQDDGTFSEDSVLGTDTTLSTIMTQASAEINKIVTGVSDSEFSRLSDIGITLTDFAGDSETPEVSNILTYDPDILGAALANNYSKVREIFEFTYNSTSSDLGILKRTNDISLTDFKVDIDTGRTAGEEVRITDTNDTFLYYATLTTIGGGYKITGIDGTSIEGLEFIYTGDGTDVITVNTSQGIADRLYNIAEGAVEDDGLLDNAVDFLNDEEDRINDEIDDINVQIENYRITLLLQFANLENAISKVNTLLQFIESQNEFIYSG